MINIATIKKFNFVQLAVFLSALLFILLLYNTLYTINLSSEYKNKIEIAKEEARPSNLEIIQLYKSNCKDCFDIIPIIDNLKSGNVNIVKEEKLSLDETKDLISKYSIEKLPAIIIKGEINKTRFSEEYVKFDDAVVFKGQTPVYFDVKLNKLVGLVKATIINPLNCENCFDVESILKQIESLKVNIENKEILNENEAANLIKKYNIKKLPVLILSNDFSYYPSSNLIWEKLAGEITEGKEYLLRESLPPYKDLEEKKVRGLVDVKFIKDSSCTECYNVLVHKNILKNFGITPVSEETIEISSKEGQDLKSKYSITKVPTIIVSSEAEVYPSFKDIFIQVGTKETDSNYIFRKTELMGVYKDLEKNQVIKPKENK